MKYFVVSDIHGYYEPLVKALAEAGYNQDDPNQTLIVLGDLLDRGNQPREVLAFIQSIDPNRLILVRGNHEDLFRDLLKKEYPDYCDFANRTLMTLFSLAFKSEGYQGQPNKRIYIEVSKGSFKAAVRKIYETGVANLILSDERWRDFVEIGNRIFVHGFYPLGQTPSQSPDKKPTPCYDPNWRNASKEAWEKARFTWGHEAIQAGLFEPERRKGKTISWAMSPPLSSTKSFLEGPWRMRQFTKKTASSPSMPPHISPNESTFMYLRRNKDAKSNHYRQPNGIQRTL